MLAWKQFFACHIVFSAKIRLELIKARGREASWPDNRMLHWMQPSVPIEIAGLTPQFVMDQKTELELTQFFAVDCPLNDLAQETAIQSRADFSEVSHEDVEVVQALLKNSAGEDGGVWDWFNFVVHSIFFSPSEVASGGTTSGAVGVIWIKQPSTLHKCDLKEILVHELTHNLMFLDEWRFGHYKDYDLVALRKNYALSPILERLRPIDKVIHALLVGMELLLLRERHLGHLRSSSRHPQSTVLIARMRNTIRCLYSMHNITDILDQRIFDLIDLCNHQINEVESRMMTTIA